MKTRERREANLIPLRAIQFGEAFEHNGDIYIKCLCDGSNGEADNRIGMKVETGRLITFSPEELVTPLDAEIVINK